MKRTSLLFVLLGMSICVSFGCSKQAPISTARLLLVIAADQFPYEYGERYRPLFRGGLKRLYDEGAVFQNAHYQHAITETCPGHASIVTGVHPSRSGIVANSWFDRKAKEEVYCVGDSFYERSPKNLLVSSLPDWVDKASSWNKIFSVSGKDRASIVLGGKRADAAYWFDNETGEFRTSWYYQIFSPNWVSRFNDQAHWKKYFGQLWTPMSEDSLDVSQYGVVNLYPDPFAKKFPHSVGKATVLPTEDFFSDIYSSPFVNELVNDFTIELIRSERLGKNSAFDYLAIGYSALDTVGHGYGPNSPEVLDTLLRLDMNLEKLFSFLDVYLGKERYLVAFTSDHGVQALPEYEALLGRKAHRMNASDVSCPQKVGMVLAEEFGSADLFLADLYLNRSEIKRKHIDENLLDQRVVEELQKCEIVEKVWSKRELLETSASSDTMLAMFKRGFLSSRSPDFFVQLKKHSLGMTREGTGHGTPYDYDTHVPIIFLGPGITPQANNTPVSPVDIAPTLASLFG